MTHQPNTQVPLALVVDAAGGRPREDRKVAHGRRPIMDMKLELVVIPFSDMDRARMFYADQLGFNLDHEVRVSGEHRVIQLTPISFWATRQTYRLRRSSSAKLDPLTSNRRGNGAGTIEA